MLACQFFQNSIDRSVKGSFGMGGRTFKLTETGRTDGRTSFLDGRRYIIIFIHQNTCIQ